MNRRSVRAKLWMIFLFAVFAIFGLGVFGVYNTKRTYESIDQVRSSAEQINEPVNELRRTVLILVMAPDRDTQMQLFAQQRDSTTALDETFRDWSDENSTAEEVEAFATVKQSWQDYRKVKDTIAQNVLDGFREEAFIDATHAGKNAFDILTQDLANWQDQMIGDAKNRYDRMFWISAAAIISISLVVTAVGGIAIREIMRPIDTLKNVATRIADQSSEAKLSAALDEKIPVHSDDELGAMAVAFNKMIDNLRSAIGRLQSEQNRTQAILNSTADGILTIGEKGEIRSCNTAAELLFKFKSQEAIGQSAGRFVPALYSEKQVYSNRSLNRGERRVLADSFESYGVGTDNVRVPLELRVIELEYAGERLYIATLQDITARKRVEEERQQIASAIARTVNRLSSASEVLTSAAAQQSSGAAAQASAVNQTSTSVNEVARTAGETAKRANEVADVASRANEIGLAGRDAVGKSIEAMADVRRQVEDTAGNIAELSEKAQTIGDITKTVNDIAEQTNVLALNAAVEASRAGEHGKGFAVVAAEVKSLALQSKEATKRVRSLLLEIKAATEDSVKSTEVGRKSANEASRIVVEAGNTIGTLCETLEKSAMSAKQIAATAQQQATAVEQVNESIQDISHVTEQNMESVHQIERSAQSLTTISLELSSLTTQKTISALTA